ncbi:hypothetical protein [Adhaeribacter aquaticus]|uniref:hypothetical protein n=1 Tax=Adhaeribacter aquaticus TaxID=299567 RepID=UPI000479EF29|nr:hypothetical protein [Adhaeribacter aquaticus]
MPQYTKTLTIQIQRHCPANGIFLRWLNPICGWDGWLFTGDTDEDAAEGESSYYLPVGARVETVLAKQVNDGLTVRAGNLTKDQARAIAFIQSSPRVQRVHPDGTVQDVKLTSYNDKIITGAEKRQTITLQIDLGKRNTQQN